MIYYYSSYEASGDKYIIIYTDINYDWLVTIFTLGVIKIDDDYLIHFTKNESHNSKKYYLIKVESLLKL